MNREDLTNAMYAAPGDGAPPVPEEPAARPRLASAAVPLVAAALSPTFVFLATRFGGDVPVRGGQLFGVLASASALVAFVSGVVYLVRNRRVLVTSKGLTAAVALFGVAFGALMTLFGAVLTLLATYGFSRGRQIRHLGRIALPPVGKGAGDGAAWTQVKLAVDVDEGVRAGLAAQWRENGRTEHASVAAFGHLTLDLVALGAPPELIAGANRDALDEIRHAELCFSLARALDGKSDGPMAFPEARRGGTMRGPRSLALVDLAVSSLVDGALNEGVSARVIAKLVKRCDEPATRAVLREIAADEGRHAAHGWDVVEWCLREGGQAVAKALEAASRTLPTAMKSTLPPGAVDGSWERFGIHGADLEAAEFAKARADVVRRVEALVGRAHAVAA